LVVSEIVKMAIPPEFFGNWYKTFPIEIRSNLRGAPPIGGEVVTIL
jgi:hypothetical protein